MKKLVFFMLMLLGVAGIVYWMYPELQREIKIWNM